MSDEGVQGAFRFIKTLWKGMTTYRGGPAPAARQGGLDRDAAAIRRHSHQTLAKVTGTTIGRRRTFNRPLPP